MRRPVNLRSETLLWTPTYILAEELSRELEWIRLWLQPDHAIHGKHVEQMVEYHSIKADRIADELQEREQREGKWF